MLDKAIAIVAVAFEGIFDKGGKPYILHCLHIMDKVKHLGGEAMIAAVLHDLLEDTKWTSKELLSVGFDPHTIMLVELLTHLADESYDDYIMRLSVSPIARAIKMADLRHNSDVTRMKGVEPKDHKRIAKYHRAYNFLNNIKD